MKYIDYVRTQENDNPLKGQEILGLLSSSLREEIQKDFFGRVLSAFKLFKLEFSSEFLKELALNFKEQTFGPGEIVYQ